MPSFEFEIATPAVLSSALVASYCCFPHAVMGGTVLVSSRRSLLPQTPDRSLGLNGRSFSVSTASAFLLSNTQRGHGRHVAFGASWANAVKDNPSAAEINVE